MHRATLVNVAHVQELHSWFAGRMMVRLKDPKQTELTVSRDRVRALKQRGIWHANVNPAMPVTLS